MAAIQWRSEVNALTSPQSCRLLFLPGGTGGDAQLAADGILTGKESSPHVSVTGGSVAADETLRIQVILDLRQDALLFSLIDMQEGGRAGTAMTVTANSAVTLQGFADSAVASLSIRVNAYAALKEMIRSSYGGRLADVLLVKAA